MKIQTRGIGRWILPQPKDKVEMVEIPEFRIGRVPFGYKKSNNEGWLTPIPLELNALEEAKKYLKQYSYMDVAAWLSTKTGRSISETGLRVRIKSEQLYGRRYRTYKSLVRRYKEALQKAEEYEKKLGTAGRDNYFNSDEYEEVKKSFSFTDKFD